MASYQKFLHVGFALDPIHVGTGGARIGRVDLTIVRDPVTRVPKIPGSSLAGVYRAYVAMDFEEQRGQAQSQQSPQQPTQAQRQKPYYPDCAGLGQPRPDGTGGHCGQPDCPVCTVFGFARGRDQAGGFAGLAAFTDAHVLLFPVPTRRGPHWVTCPMALRLVGREVSGVQENAVYMEKVSQNKLNLGWLFLDVRECQQFGDVKNELESLGVPNYIRDRLAILPDHLFIHVVNSNLEVRTSVSINPETGAAEEGALFSYEALPRTTVLVWEVIAKNPRHFKISGNDVNVTLSSGQKMDGPDKVLEVTKKAHPYLEHLGIGGMGTRGMGRLKVLYAKQQDVQEKSVSCQGEPQAAESGQPEAQPEQEASHESASEKTIANLDIRCAELGRELASITGIQEKVLNEVLAVLEEQGLYAMFLYIQARHREIAGSFKSQCVNLLRDDFGKTLPQEALGAAKELADDLDNLLFARELLRNALAYARYYLKAKGSGS